MAKHAEIARLLGKRIEHGDYMLGEFPTDRDLAAEIGASTVTTRKAVQHLIDEKLLIRLPNGRPAVNRRDSRRRGQLVIALLAVAYSTPVIERWRRRLVKLAQERDWVVRLVSYGHYDDPVIRKTLESFDGVFFVPSASDPPKHLIERFRERDYPIIALDYDWTPWGIRSLLLNTPASMLRLLEYVGSLGHERIACLNTQPMNAAVRQRIEPWQFWMAAHGAPAPLINEPVQPFESASWQAYHVMKKRLMDGELGGATALHCVTGAAALGALRALHECGLKAGRDIALCSADDDCGQTPLWTPSVTAMQEPDAEPYLSVCLDWMGRQGHDWMGPMLVQPAQSLLFVGESTDDRGAGLIPPSPSAE